jgi:Ulp1 family protease
LDEVVAEYGKNSVQRKSMERLKTTTRQEEIMPCWINDEVLVCYLGKLVDIVGAKTHVFNPHFLVMLLNQKHSSRVCRGKFEYDNAQKWGKRVCRGGIFELDKLFIPVNLGDNHWILIVV